MDTTSTVSIRLFPDDKARIAAIKKQLESKKPDDSLENVTIADVIRDALRFRVHHLDSECPGRES